MADSHIKGIQEQLDKVKLHYVLPFDLDATESEIKRVIKGRPEWLACSTNLFLENIGAAVITVKFPYTSAKTSVLIARFRQLTIRHRILVARDAITIENMDREITPEGQVEQNAMAHERALRDFLDEQNDTTLREQIAFEWSGFLLDSLQDKQMDTAAKELLRQAVVMIWGAFEVLCRDIFVGHLNSNPTEVQKLTLDSETRKIFQAKAIDLEVLSTYGFDVSSSLGDVFANAYDLSSLGAIRQTFTVMFPVDHDLHQHLRDKTLWILHQRRHLIVHKRGIIDQQYLERTGEKFQIGQQLTPTPSEIEGYVRLVCDAALALVMAAAKE